MSNMMFQFLSNAFGRSFDEREEQDKNRFLGADHDRLPILIIPGFMSSGLEIEHSPKRPKWKGKRIWLNLKSLGVEHLTQAALLPWEKILNKENRKGTGYGTWATDEQQQEEVASEEPPPSRSQMRRLQSEKEEKENIQSLQDQQAKIRSAWCQHMMLAEDFVSERDGVRIRAIDGLEGVNYLYPGFMTGMITYVFGPLIDFLTASPNKQHRPEKKQQPTNQQDNDDVPTPHGGGYKAGVDLQAAPWDWRMPPSELEKRDQYFSRTLAQIESMYEACDNLPVVLLAHSLGTLATQYMLQYALEHKGQEWIDKHIYAYVPVGGTHAGAPKSIKQTILVGGSIVQSFLKYEEAVLMGRSLGSAPWLFPTEMPPEAPAAAYVHPQGILQIKLTQTMDVAPLIQGRNKSDQPRRYQLQVALGKTATMNDKKNVRLVSSQFLDTTDATKRRVDFRTETYCFVTPPDDWKEQDDFVVQLYLREPEWTKNLKSNLKKQPILKQTGLVDLCVFPFAFCTPATPKQTTVQLEISWNAFDRSPATQLCNDVAQPHENGISLSFQNSETGEIYQPMSGHDALHREGRWGHTFLKTIKKVYESDPYGPTSISARDPPPVKRVHAIYGTNVPTDIGSFFCRVDQCVSKLRPGVPLFHLDSSGAKLKTPELKESAPSNDDATTQDQFVVEGPILNEVTTATQPCGDGTVPYWSLNWIKNWKPEISSSSTKSRVESVTIKELPGAPHREILSDKRFYAEILRYCTRKKEAESARVE